MKILILLFLTGVVWSRTETTAIHSVSPRFLKLESGSVAFWNSKKPKTLFQSFVFPGQKVTIYLNDKNEIEGIRPHFDFREHPADKREAAPSLVREPTIFPRMSFVRQLLHSFRSDDTEDSQCYDRAHVWSYEADQYESLSLMKGWIFFADHYIEKYRFKWWFHVAPMTFVQTKQGIKERILDKKFSDIPLSIEQWSDMFMENKKSCPEVILYTDYSWHPLEEDCYFMRTSPYFWQPRDLEEKALSGFEKNYYIPWEIDHAFKQAFGVTRDQ